MAIELNDDGKKAILDVYNDSIKLLELLSILIPKVDKFDSKLPHGLMSEISDICFNLGATLATSDFLEEKSKEQEKPEEDEEENMYPFGM